MAWLPGWDKRIEITISNTNVDSDLTHFPMLLALGISVGTGNTDVTCVFDELTEDANRKKIAVTESDGTTQLYVEIEEWDDGNEKAFLWVSKSDWVIASAATTKIYLYYDAGRADNTTYVGGINSTPGHSVWNSHYKLVWHMIDETTSTVKDSTSNDNNGTKEGANEPIEAPGEIGQAQDFDGSDDYIVASSALTTLTQSAHTISVLTKPDDVTPLDTQVIISAGDGTHWWAIFQDCVGGSSVSWDDDDLKLSCTGEALIQDTWYSVTMRRSGTEYSLFQNTAKQADTETVGNDFDVEEVPYAGQAQWGGYKFEGLLDEIRISDTDRSDAWIKADYYAQDDNIVSWGSEKETMRIAGVRLSDAEKVCGIAKADIEAVAGVSNTS